MDESELRSFLNEDYVRVVNTVALAGLGFAHAEDAVQEALVRAWIRTAKGGAIERLDSWVTVVAWNLSRSGLRRLGAERRARQRLAAGLVDGGSGPAPEDTVDIARALSELPRRAREVAVLRYLLHLTTAETADALGIAEGTVKRTLADARASLSASLAIDETEEVPDVADR